MNSKKLAALGRITQLRLDLELSKLGELQRKDEELFSELNSLRNSHDTSQELIGGHSENWSRWKERRARELNIERASLWARIEEQRDACQLAFGKHHAIRTLVKKN